MDPHH